MVNALEVQVIFDLYLRNCKADVAAFLRFLELEFAMCCDLSKLVNASPMWVPGLVLLFCVDAYTILDTLHCVSSVLPSNVRFSWLMLFVLNCST